MKPILFNTDMTRAILDGKKKQTRRLIKRQADKDLASIKPPFKAGEVLYVRETWNYENICEHICPVTGEISLEPCGNFVYKADGDKEGQKWKPSIHMPKKAARLFLKITSVEKQKLDDIPEEDAKSEGMTGYTKDNSLFKYCVNDNWWIKRGGTWSDMPKTAKKAFELYWDSLIDKKDVSMFGWAANPAVWVVRFEVIKENE